MDKLTSPESNFYKDCPEVVDHMILVMKKHNRKAMFIHELERYNKEEGATVNDKLLFLFGDYKIDQKKAYIDILEEGKFRYKVIEGAGHGINHEQAKRVNSEIIEFILQI